VSTPTRWRAGDADREQVAEALRTAHAEGRLSLDEFGERLDTAFAATYVDELGPLTADLPPDSSAVEVVRPTPRARPVPRLPGRYGAWAGVNPAWSGAHPAWPHGPAAGRTSYGASPPPYEAWPAAHGCSGWSGLSRPWVGLLALVAVFLAMVMVAAGGAPWPLLWLAIAFVVLRRRPRSGLRRTS
jgi:hypothetical protein